MKFIFLASPKSMLHREFFVIALTNAFVFPHPSYATALSPNSHCHCDCDCVSPAVSPHTVGYVLNAFRLQFDGSEMTQCIRDGNETEPKNGKYAYGNSCENIYVHIDVRPCKRGYSPTCNRKKEKCEEAQSN